jgi:hypothetical protein
MLRRVIWWKFTDISKALSASIFDLLMKAPGTSKTSVNYQTTRCNNAEDSHLHTRSREDLKSQ